MGEGFWSLRVQASDTGQQSNDTCGCECPDEPQFPGSFNWGKNSFGLKSYRHCDFKGSIFRDQAFFPCSLEISVLRTLTLI